MRFEIILNGFNYCLRIILCSQRGRRARQNQFVFFFFFSNALFLFTSSSSSSSFRIFGWKVFYSHTTILRHSFWEYTRRRHQTIYFSVNARVTCSPCSTLTSHPHHCNSAACWPYSIRDDDNQTLTRDVVRCAAAAAEAFARKPLKLLRWK